MKAIRVFEPGDSSVLKLVDMDRPQLKPGWSLIKVKGFGINRSEILTRQGHSPSVSFPRVLGIECVGIIEESSDLARLPLGQKVVSIMGEMGRAFDGSYAEYVLVPNEQIYPIETELDWPQLAAVPETYYTAYGSLKTLKIEPRDTVLVRGASSGVGLAFASLIKALHPQVTLLGSSRRPHKNEQLQAAGYDQIILDQDGKLHLDQPVDKILDLVGPTVIKDSLVHLQSGGIICSTGILGGKWFLEDFDPIMLLSKNTYLTSFYSGQVDQASLQEVFDIIETHNLLIQPQKIFSLEDLAQAHDYLDSQDSFGKVVIIND